ncbi:Metallocarboxypeptidase A like protein [Verticillium longisporum]|nr:Metallocarboxypeptidase A like protein [Verticillium longisporum]
MKFRTATLAVLAAAVAATEFVTYDGYQVFRVATGSDTATVQAQLEALDAIVEDDHHAPGHLDVAIAPENLEAFQALGLASELLQEDLGADIAAESQGNVYRRRQNDDSTLPDLSWWDAYHPYAEHGDFFDDLHASFPNNSELFVAGKSYEGRDIYGIHFWGKDGKDANPAVSWHSTVHAREWVSALTTEYLAYKLISGYLEGDKGTQALVDKFDYYVIPFVNPDGFVFTQTSTRLWRKNRQPRANTTCVGTDGNRNWPFGWHYPGGASDNPCGETYRGLAAADTPEIASLVAWTDTVKAKHGVKLFIDFHSYGQYALQPYGYDCSVVPPNFDRQVHVAKCYADAVFAVNGSKYVYGSSCRELYATTGSAPDFHAGAVEAEFAWTIELRPASAGAGGFVLPPEQIRPNVGEQWAGLQYVLSVA